MTSTMLDIQNKLEKCEQEKNAVADVSVPSILISFLNLHMIKVMAFCSTWFPNSFSALFLDQSGSHQESRNLA